MKQNQILKAYVWLISTIRDYGPIPLKEINEMWITDKKQAEALQIWLRNS